MPGFSGINMALRALLAHQQALEITQHNVANANTPGFHRQEAVLRAGLPTEVLNYPSSGTVGQMGTGVMVDRIKRFNLDFVDTRYRSELGESSRYKTEAEFLKQVESTLQETGADGMATQLDNFWAGWRALSTNPDDTTARNDLVEKSQGLVNAFSGRMTRLKQLRNDQNTAILQRVDEVNKTASEVGRLNSEIARVMSNENQPNDLLDERDRLMDRLSELTGATYFIEDKGMMNVSVGGHSLVFGTSTYAMTATPDASGLIQVGWQDGQPYQGRNGEIFGLVDARDNVIVDQMNRLNTLAQNFTSAVNTVHRTGFGLNNANGLDFFTSNAGGWVPGNPITADAIQVNTVIDPAKGGDVRNIASAQAINQPGNGNIALAIADLSTQTQAALGGLTFNAYNTDRVSKLALEVNRADTNASNHGNLVKVIGDQREAVIGVNMDEEAANMAKYQRSYQAAARLMNAVDQMLDKVINGMGMVGR